MVRLTGTSEATSQAGRGYAALGASETAGVGATPQSNGYAYLVARALHAQPFRNLGISGTTLSGGYRSELSGALAIRPRLATVFFGFNDLRNGVSRDAFVRDLYRLVKALRQAHIQVVIIGLPDLSRLPVMATFPVQTVRQIVTSWDNGMRDVARKTGAQFLDLRKYNAELAHHPEYVSADGLHPSNAGYARLAQEVVRFVKRKGLWTAR